jgi:hypothetical protein
VAICRRGRRRASCVNATAGLPLAAQLSSRSQRPTSRAWRRSAWPRRSSFAGTRSNTSSCWPTEGAATSVREAPARSQRASSSGRSPTPRRRALVPCEPHRGQRRALLREGRRARGCLPANRRTLRRRRKVVRPFDPTPTTFEPRSTRVERRRGAPGRFPAGSPPASPRVIVAAGSAAAQRQRSVSAASARLTPLVAAGVVQHAALPDKASVHQVGDVVRAADARSGATARDAGIGVGARVGSCVRRGREARGVRRTLAGATAKPRSPGLPLDAREPGRHRPS